MRLPSQLINILRSSPLIFAVACGPSAEKNLQDSEEKIEQEIKEISKAPEPKTYQEKMDEHIAFLQQLKVTPANVEAKKKFLRREYKDHIVPGLFEGTEGQPLKDYIFHLKDKNKDLEEARYLIPTILGLPKFRDSKSSDQRYMAVLDLPEREYEPEFKRIPNENGSVTIVSTGSLGKVNEMALVVKMPELTNKQEAEIRDALFLFDDFRFDNIERFESWLKRDGIRRKIPSKPIHLIDYPPQSAKE